jgi:hypothetical protein
VSGGTHAPTPRAGPVGYRALTVCGGPSQGPSPSTCFAHSAESRLPLLAGRSTPTQHRPTGHLAVWVWALPRSLAATGGISFDFCAGGTKMFLFPPSPSLVRDPRGYPGGLPHSDIDGSPGVRPLPVASRSRTTSFIGSTTPGHSPSAVSRFRAQRALALRDFSRLLQSMNLVRCLGPGPSRAPSRVVADACSHAGVRWRRGGSNP